MNFIFFQCLSTKINVKSWFVREFAEYFNCFDVCVCVCVMFILWLLFNLSAAVIKCLGCFWNVCHWLYDESSSISYFLCMSMARRLERKYQHFYYIKSFSVFDFEIFLVLIKLLKALDTFISYTQGFSEAKHGFWSKIWF